MRKLSVRAQYLIYFYFYSRIQSVKGKRVLQIDPNSFYGGPQAGTHKVALSPHDPLNPHPSRSFILHDPSPIIFYARGPLSELLLSLELTEYLEFMAIDQQYIWPSERVLIPLPLSKEQIMLEGSLTLLEKRKFTKLLGFAATLLASSSANATATLGELFRREGVDPESRVFQLIAYGACRCSSLQEVESLSLNSTMNILESLRESINHLNGRGSPFVLPLWGSSELSQAACRKAAVFGCTQILEKSITDIQAANINFNNSIVQSHTDNNYNYSIFRATWVLNGPVLGLSGNVLITVPPSSDLIPNPSASSINILQLTSDSHCCPPGTCKSSSVEMHTFLILFVGIVYLWSQSLLQDPSIISRIEGLITGSASILTSFPLEEVSIPFYSHNDTEIGPFQPILPASLTFEQEFVDSLHSIANKI